MRQETIVRTIVKYEELSEEQKQKVCEKLHDLHTDYAYWHEGVFEDKTKILELLGFSGVKLSFSGFWSQGDGASFTGHYNVPQNKKETNERIKKVKQYAPDFDFSMFLRMSFNKEEKEEGKLKVYRIGHHYSHEYTVKSDNISLTDFVRDFSKTLYRDLEKTHDYLSSREAIEEGIEANGYEFYIDSLDIA